MSLCDWRSIHYLSQGSERQQALHRLLVEERLLERVAPLDVACVSSICLELDLPESDVDIICEDTPDGSFAELARKEFEEHDDFLLRQFRRSEEQITVASFRLRGFAIEFFATAKPIELQNAWKHLTAFSRLLRFGGEVLRERVVELKLKGLKTEPAFAEVLCIGGDPYEELFRLADVEDAELQRLVLGVGL